MMFETCALLTFCAALLVSGSVSLAWFSVNTKVNSSVGMVEIKNLDTQNVSLRVYNVTDISDSKFTFKDSDINALNMPFYDKYELQYNQEDYKRALVLEFSFDNNEVQKADISADTTNGQLSISANNKISNAVSFYVAEKQRDSSVIIDSSKEKSFVYNDVSTGEYKKNSSVKLTDSHVSVSNTNSLWVVLQYNKDIVDYITNAVSDNMISGSVTNDDITNGENIIFESDISFSIIFYEG